MPQAERSQAHDAPEATAWGVEHSRTWRPQPAETAEMAEGGDQLSSSRRLTTSPEPMPQDQPRPTFPVENPRFKWEYLP